MSGIVDSAANSLKNTANSVSEGVQSLATGASKEANKNVAKDSNAPIGTRVEASVDALQDKGKEESHSAKKEAHKQAI